jgi:hypothetical protein
MLTKTLNAYDNKSFFLVSGALSRHRPLPMQKGEATTETSTSDFPVPWTEMRGASTVAKPADPED